MVSFLTMYVAFAQTDSTKYLYDKFDNYNMHHLQEKAFIHTDKDHYLSGELIWFKIYVTDAYLNKATEFSKICYLELFDVENKPVTQLKLGLKNGISAGNLQLPKLLTSGKYILRAYTTIMGNSNPDFFYHKVLTIHNTFDNSPGNYTLSSVHQDSNFYVEGGGKPIEELNNNIFFKIKPNPDISDVYLLNQINDTVVKFKLNKYGFSKFNFKPLKGHSYRAFISYHRGKSSEIKFPSVSESGYSLIMSKQEGRLSLEIESSKKNVEESVYFISHTRGLVDTVLKIPIKNGYALLSIDENSLASGINTFLILGHDYSVLVQRLFFKKPLQDIDLSLSTDKSTYTTRAEVSLGFDFNQILSQDSIINLSLSVYQTDENKYFHDYNNISNYLFLESDFGNIDILPSDISSVSQDDIDIYLNTKKMSADIHDILSTKKHQFLNNEIYNPIISVNVYNKIDGKPSINKHIYLSIPTLKVPSFYESLTDSSGKAKFYVPQMYGQHELVFQPDSFQDTLTIIKLNSPFSDKMVPIIQGDNHTHSFDSSLMIDKKIKQQIHSAFHRLEYKNLLPHGDKMWPFYGKPDKSYIIDDYKSFPTIRETIKEYIYDVSVREEGNQAILKVSSDENNSYRFDKKPLILFDGIPVLNLTQLLEYNPKLVKRVDVLRKEYQYGNLDFGGIVSFITHEHDAKNFKYSKGTFIYNYEGLNTPSSFNEITYKENNNINKRIPDFRTTLYWNPNFTLTSKQQRLQFYTSDYTGRYVIVAQGISSSGIPIFAFKYFNVKSEN